MDEDNETLIAVLHGRMEQMTAQERIDLLRAIAGGPCNGRLCISQTRREK